MAGDEASSQGRVIDLPKRKAWARDTKDRRLWLRIATGVWYVRAKRKGKKPLFRSTGETGVKAARNKAEVILAEWMGTRPAPDARVTFRDFALDYLEHLKKTPLRPRTKDNAELYIGQLVDEIGDSLLADINEGYFDVWLTQFRAASSRTTFNDYAKYLSKVMRHAHRRGLIPRLPQFKNPDPPKKAGRVYSRDEICHLLGVADPRLELQIRLSLQGFMRLREALLLSWDRVDLVTGKITLRPEDVKTGSKTGEGREFILGHDVLAKLRVWRHESTGPWVFPSWSDRTKPQWSNKTAWKRAKRLAGIKGRARWHDLRHTALTWALVEQKQNPLFVSVYAGVSMRTIQRVYLHTKPEDTRAVGECIEI